jgi:hypothetical protein
VHPRFIDSTPSLVIVAERVLKIKVPDNLIKLITINFINDVIIEQDSKKRTNLKRKHFADTFSDFKTFVDRKVTWQGDNFYSRCDVGSSVPLCNVSHEYSMSQTQWFLHDMLCKSCSHVFFLFPLERKNFFVTKLVSLKMHERWSRTTSSGKTEKTLHVSAWSSSSQPKFMNNSRELLSQE